jgi:hypothetical protein
MAECLPSIDEALSLIFSTGKTNKQTNRVVMCDCILVPRRLRQEALEFKVSLGCIVRSCLKKANKQYKKEEFCRWQMGLNPDL